LSCTRGSTQEKSHISVGNVVSTSARLQILNVTRVSTLERSRSNVMCVVKSSVGLHSSSLIREFTQGRSLTSVRYVVRASVGDQILQFTTESMLLINPIELVRPSESPPRKKVV
jgi:hypothetical protein